MDQLGLFTTIHVKPERQADFISIQELATFPLFLINLIDG
jgi:hypothetical protein